MIFRVKRFIRYYLTAIVTSFIVLLVTLLLYIQVQSEIKQRVLLEFGHRTTSATNAISLRLRDYAQILRGAQAFVNLTDTINRQEWKNYVDLLELEKNFPGLQGLGYTVFVTPEDSIRHTQQIRNEGFPEYQIRPYGKRETYSSIIFIEPFDLRNQRAFGYDMFSDSVRRIAMSEAMKTNTPVITGKVKLVQETEEDIQPGFLMYLPIFKNNDLQNIQGFVYYPFRSFDFMKAILTDNYPDLDVEVYNGGEINERTLLYNKEGQIDYNDDKAEFISTTQIIKFGDIYWRIYYRALPGVIYSPQNNIPNVILISGIIISFLVFGFLWSYANNRRLDVIRTNITDNASAALFLINHKGFCVFMNPAAHALFGFDSKQVNEEPLISLISYGENDKYDRKKAFNELTYEIKNAEDTFRNKEGNPIYVLCSFKPIFESGSFFGKVIEVRDITELKSSELKIKESASALGERTRTLELINEIGRIISGELNLNDLVQKVTDAATKITGAEFGAFFYNVINEKNESYTLYSLSGVSPDVFKNYPMPRNTKIFSPTFYGEEVVVSGDISKDHRYGQNPPYNGMPEGHIPVVSYLAVPVVSRSGEVLGGLFFGHSEKDKFGKQAIELAKGIASQTAIAIDNSRLFESMQKKNRDLEKINNDLDSFIYTASHDLKAPISNIEGLVDALKDPEIPKEDFFQILELMNLAVTRFKNTIQDLTDISKLQKELEGEPAEEISIGEIIDEVKDELKNIIPPSCRIDVNLQVMNIKFIKKNIRSIVYNLLSNAIKYRSQERECFVNISTYSKGNHTVLNVRDNGLGIPEEKIGQLFTMFKRFHDHVEGTGIGLYIVKRMVENAGGTIEVSSKENEGTEFKIMIPKK
ncbi:MAG: CHASE domain-containing protein [Cytophagaceae bacterium]